jgi:hypothetical protein
VDALPIWLLFVLTVVAVLTAMEIGYWVGLRVGRRPDTEKEVPVSVVSSATLGLLAFILSFTFSIVSNRYDARKGLVREEANAIRTAYVRADFLSEADRAASEALLKGYVDHRLAVVRSGDREQMLSMAHESSRMQRELWRMAVANARVDMNSDVGALYVEALNEMANLHSVRVAIGLQARLPRIIWLALVALLFLGMTGIGYQTGVAGSRRSWSIAILAGSFALVVALIAALDRPETGYFVASQRPLEELRAWMDESKAR